jgi:hypothetical protein
MIRETYQDPSQAGHVSFPPRGFERIRPYVNDRAFRRGLDIDEDGEEEEGYIGEEDMDNMREETSDFDDKNMNDV